MTPNINKFACRLEAAKWPHVLLIIFILAATFSVCMGFIKFFRTDVPHLDWDEAEYWSLSSDLLSLEFGDPGRRTLGFPLVLATLRLINSSYLAVQIMVTILAATAPPLLAHAVYLLSNNRLSSAIAGLALAVWPPQVFLATSLYSETIALPCFLATLCLLPKGPEPARMMRYLIAGIAFGIVCHVRTMYQLFLPFIFIVYIIEHRSFLRSATLFGITTAGFLLAVLPWSVFVSERTNSTIFLTANGGETLAGGLNPVVLTTHAQTQLEKRTSWVGPGKWIHAAHTGYLTESELRQSYVRQNQLLTSRAIDWIENNPGPAAYITYRKIAYMWGIYPFFANDVIMTVFGNLAIVSLSALFVLCLLNDRSLTKSGSRFYLLPLFVTGIAIVSWGSWRFRQPADAGMIAIVSWFLGAYIQSRLATWRTNLTPVSSE